MFVGRLACKLYERMRREAAAIKVQKHLRAYQAKKAYTRLKMSVLVLQTGFRAMAARNEFRFRKQTKAATAIQVIIDFLCYICLKISFMYFVIYGYCCPMIHSVGSLALS